MEIDNKSRSFDCFLLFCSKKKKKIITERVEREARDDPSAQLAVTVFCDFAIVFSGKFFIFLFILFYFKSFNKFVCPGLWFS